MGDPRVALQRARGHFVITRDAGDFLDQIRLTLDVTPPSGNVNFELVRRSVGAGHEAELFKDFDLLCLRDFQPSQLPGLLLRIEVVDDFAAAGRLPCTYRQRGLATANVENESCQDRQSFVDEAGIDAALKPAARVAANP